MPTPHFRPEALRFLRSLKTHNDREWFNARKDVYERELKTPMLTIVDAVTRAMEEWAPDHVRPANKIVMRIYRDTRFSKNKLPYKTNLAAWWSRHGMEKTSGGGYYLQVGPAGVLASAGVYMPEREQLLLIRRHLAETHEEFRALHTKLLRAKAMGFTPIDGAALSRTPKGFDKESPADDLVRAQNWGVHAELPASLAESATLVREIAKRFKAVAPLVEFLNAPIVPKKKSSQASWL